MTRHVFIWIVLTYTCYHTCRAYTLIKFDQNPNYKSPLYGPLERDIENLEAAKKKSRTPENAHYSTVIENLRNSWSMPSVYLQKRGYIKNVPKDDQHDFPDETEDKNYEYKNNELIPSRKISRDIKNEIELDDANSCSENGKNQGPETPVVEHVVKEVSTPKPGFFKKIANMFSRKNSSSLAEEEQSALKELTDSLNLLQNDYDHELYDVIALQNPNENLFDRSLPRRSNPNRKNNENMYNSLQKSSLKSCPERPNIKHNIFTKDINNEELFKNLSQTDLEYVKNFLQCFKENKSKFLIDYLHVSPPIPSEKTSNETATSTPSTTTLPPECNTTKSTTLANSTRTLQANITTVSKSKENGLKNLTTETSANKTNKSENNTEKNGLDLDLDLNSTNNTQSGCKPNESVNVKTSVESCDYVKPVSLDLLKFLAHMHHDVTEVGKPPHKSLSAVTNSACCDNSDVSGEDSSKNCTPFRLNELSLDLEVASDNKSKAISPLSLNFIKKRTSGTGDKTDWDGNGNDVVAQFLEGQRENQLNSFRIQPPYADNFLDQADEADGDSHSQDIDKGSHFLSKLSKKREVAHSEEEILSDISSSLSKLAFDPSTEKGRNRDDDYLEKIKNDNSNDEDYYFDDESTNQSKYDRKGARRSRKRKKNKKLYMRNDADISSDEPAEPVQEVEVGSKNMFSDFQDIKFRMNPQQEEDIQTFIESLNSPPEVFSFNVDQYIKQPDRVTKELKQEPIPQRKYYEFIETPSIENEEIPLFQSSLGANKEILKNEISLNLDHAGKRDLLRQYIKGVSNRLNEIDRTHENEKKIKEPFEKREQEKFSNDETAMLTSNYPQNFEAVYRQKLHDNDHKVKPVEEIDDFVDKYYLLNDGSVQIYHPQKVNLKQSYDPDGLQMDLDLNKKFKDLTLTSGAFNQKINEKEKS